MVNGKISWKLLLLTALLVSFILCLLMPLSMYDSNPSEFPMTAYSELLFYSVVLTVAATAIIFLLLLAVGRWFPKLLLPSIGLVLGLSVALYAQGNLIGADYGALDGHVIRWDLMCTIAIVNTLVWIVCISIPVLVAIFARRFAEKCFGLAVPILLAYVSLLSVMLFFANISAFGRNKPASFTLNKFMEFSTERNLVVIILDSFDRAVFDILLRDDPSLRERFAGFTYYHNTVSAFCYTALALPQIVSGYGNPEDGLTIWEYQRKVYQNAPFLRMSKSLGYEVDAYYSETEYPSVEELHEVGFFGNAVDNTPKVFSRSNGRHYLSLYLCSAFRYLPHLLKKIWWLHQDDFKEVLLSDNVHSARIEDNLRKHLCVGELSTVQMKKIKIYHCVSIHVPFFGLERAKKSIEMVGKFIDVVRAAGLDEKTDFFIMADHGSINRCRPLFMCSNGTAEFKVSEMSFSYRHLFEAYADSLKGRVITPIEAELSEMVPIIDDPRRTTMDVVVDEKVFPGIGTEFADNGLELLATSAELDVVAISDEAKMTWSGKQANLWVPVEEALQNDKLCLELTFDKVFADSCKPRIDFGYVAKQSRPIEYSLVTVSNATIAVIKLPKMPDGIDKRIVKLTLHQWEGDDVPAITKVKIGLCDD